MNNFFSLYFFQSSEVQNRQTDKVEEFFFLLLSLEFIMFEVGNGIYV